MTEPTKRELELAASTDLDLLAIERQGLPTLEHSAKNREAIAQQLSGYRIELEHRPWLSRWGWRDWLTAAVLVFGTLAWHDFGPRKLRRWAHRGDR